VRAVIAESYERIHRSNLVGMGVLPLEFEPGQTPASLGLTGQETFSIEGIAGLSPRKKTHRARARRLRQNHNISNDRARRIRPKKVSYYQHGGILRYVLRQML